MTHDAPQSVTKRHNILNITYKLILNNGHISRVSVRSSG
jgi:hypothetical protein